METSIAASKDMLQDTSLLPNKGEISMNQLDKPWQVDTRFSTTVYAFNAMRHLHNTKLNL